MPASYLELWSARRSVKRSLALLFVLLALVFLLRPGVEARDLGLQESSPLAYVAGSLSLSHVIAGEPAYFELTVTNVGGAEVTLDATTSLSFGDAETGQYVAPLLAPVTVPDGAQAVLRFQSVALAADFPPGVVALLVSVSGQLGGGGFSQTLAVGDSLTVLAPQTGLAEVTGTLQPTDPSRASMVVFWLRLENTTNCPIQLNSGSEIILRNEQEWLQRTPLYKSITIQPGASARVEFGTLGEQGRTSSYIKDSIPDGTYYPHLRLFGIRTCDTQPFSTLIESAQNSPAKR